MYIHVSQYMESNKSQATCEAINLGPKSSIAVKCTVHQSVQAIWV